MSHTWEEIELSFDNGDMRVSHVRCTVCGVETRKIVERQKVTDDKCRMIECEQYAPVNDCDTVLLESIMEG